MGFLFALHDTLRFFPVFPIIDLDARPTSRIAVEAAQPSWAILRLVQLDKIIECLSHHVMEHHEEMVWGLHLVKELERDLKIATIICMNGRRHLTSSMNQVSRDLIVTSNSKKKQVLLELLPILTELCHARDIQKTLERHIEEGN